MRSICTETDAREVIEIMQASMADYYEDEMGGFDFSRSMNGSGPSKISTLKHFVAALQKISDEKKSKMFSYDELKHLIEVNLKINFDF